MQDGCLSGSVISFRQGLTVTTEMQLRLRTPGQEATTAG